MTKARILYLITKAEVGGAQIHLAELIRGFHREFDLYLAAGQNGFLVREARDLGIRVTVLRHLVHSIKPWKDVRALAEVLRLVVAVRPNLVHAHTAKAGVIARLAAFGLKVPSVYTVHGWQFADGVPLPRKLLALPVESLAAEYTDRIIVVSEADRRLASRYGIDRSGRIVVIRNGIPDVPWRANPAEGNPVRVVMVARFAPPKAQDQLLRALAPVKDRRWVLQLVGDGPTRTSAERLADRLGMSDRVMFLGERTDVAKLLAQSHVFVLASNWEGFPLTVLEAMRAGLPVVASDVGGVDEAVVDGETGFLVPRGNIEALRERIVRLIQSPALRLSMGKAGRIRYEQQFTVERMLQQTRSVYHDVLAAPA
jgi:glycosyltransferase involved in cell wall biosynthesis